MSLAKPVFKHRIQMEQFCKEVLDEGDLNMLIHRVSIKRNFTEPEKLWIVWKVSQIQCARNIIAIASNGLEIIGVDS